MWCSESGVNAFSRVQLLAHDEELLCSAAGLLLPVLIVVEAGACEFFEWFAVDCEDLSVQLSQ